MLFILLCIQAVLQVLSELQLAPPQNIHVDKWLLTWTPATEERDVFYTVEYRSFNTNVWKKVPACIQTSLTYCNVALIEAGSEHGCVMLRVRAQRHGLTSRPAKACSRQGESCTPEVTLTARPGSLTIYLNRNHSMAHEHRDHLKYRVYYGKEGESLQKYKDHLNTVSIPELEEGQRYCTKVQYLYFDKPIGPESCVQCEDIPESKHESNQTEVIIAVVVVVVVVVLVPVIAYVLIFQHGKIKQWMRPPYEIPPDFLPESFPHLTSSTCSPSEEHWDVISFITIEERQ